MAQMSGSSIFRHKLVYMSNYNLFEISTPSGTSFRYSSVASCNTEEYCGLFLTYAK